MGLEIYNFYSNILVDKVTKCEVNSTSSSLLFCLGHCIDEQFVEIASISGSRCSIWHRMLRALLLIGRCLIVERKISVTFEGQVESVTGSEKVLLSVGV